MPGTVIPARAYVHTDGRRASIYGAVPWTSDAGKADWSIIETGFSIQHPDGTIGLGRVPFKTREDAQAWVDTHPNFPGMNQG